MAKRQKASRKDRDRESADSALRTPNSALKVTLTVSDGKIIVEAAKKAHGRYKIEDLIAAMPADYQAQEIDWGAPLGREEGYPAG